MKFRYTVPILLVLLIFLFRFSWGVVQSDSDSLLRFREVWGYLMRGEEKYFNDSAPITDVFYFSAGVNRKGRISTAVYPPFKPAFEGGNRRIHLVISDLDHPERMRLCLNTRYGVRYYLIKDIVEVSKKFDGIQIDFEAVENRDSRAFHLFLRDLRRSLSSDKTLSVAVPPKRIDVDDAYDYRIISRYADRLLVMAYDQHWSKSNPGPVASLQWCSEVATYALKNIPRRKLIMGLPLYGREWCDSGVSRSLRWSQVDKLLERDDAVIEYSVDEGFKVMYDENMKTTFYIDDIKATRKKLIIYHDYNVGIGFWRLGMEDESLWRLFTVSGG